MRQDPRLQMIENNMHQGVLATYGFLGSDTRSLADVLQADQIAVHDLGTDHRALATKMRSFTAAGLKALGVPVTVNRLYQVTVEEFKGSIPCPFGDNYQARKVLTQVSSPTKTLYWSDLNLHMIEEHGFYEGIGARYRIDPRAIAELLEEEADRR